MKSMEKNYFLNLFSGVKRSATITSEKKIELFLMQSLLVLLIVLFLPIKSLGANPIDVGFLPKYITESFKEAYRDPVSMLIIVPPFIQKEVDENHSVVLQNSIFAVAVDTDDDGEPDTTDIDDDNDGVLDTDEGFCALQETIIKYNTSSSASAITSSDSDVASSVFQFSEERVGAGMRLSYSGGQRNFSRVNQQDLLGATSGNDYIEYNIVMNQYASGNLGEILINPAADNQTNGFTITTYLYKGTTTSTPLVTSTQYFSNEEGDQVQIADFTAIEIEANQTYIVRYHLYNVDLGATVTNTNATRHKIYTNCYIDTDNDGVPNHLDLDSDNDTCSDSVEAGNTSVNDNSTTVFKTGADNNRNGLIDAFEDGTSGTINYTSSYALNAISVGRNACADTDGDGVGDLIDLDDDNDGVLDIDEKKIIVCDSKVNWTNFSASGLGAYPGTSNLAEGKLEYEGESFNVTVDYGADTMWLENGTHGGANSKFVDYDISEATPKSLHFRNTNTITVTFDRAVSNPVFLFASANGRNIQWPSTTEVIALKEYNLNTSTYVSSGSSGNAAMIGIIKETKSVFTITILSSEFRTSFNVGFLCKNQSLDIDTDSDGIPNRLDLDSDNDGCSDAVEAGNTLASDNNITDYPTGIDVNNNGLLDKFEDGTSGNINYISRYSTNALSNLLNACLDSDNDGVGDLIDLDDDNDGIRDSDESPSCYGTKDIYEVGNRSERITVSSDLNMNATYNQPGELVDGDEGTTTANYAVKLIAENISNLEVFRFDFDAPIELSRIYLLYKNQYTHFNNGVVRIQGSNNGTNWTTLSEDVNYKSTSTKTGIKNRGLVYNNTFNITKNQASYSSYRLMGVSGNSYVHGITLETIFEITNFIREWYPLATCEENEDLDGDGVANHLDTDMDGDGCLDIVESGAGTIGDTTVSGNVGQNGWADNLETTPDSGVINYELQRFYMAANLNSCLDTDGDGIGDLIDIDDDNDGVLDTEESDFCPIDLNSESYRRWLRQRITITTVDRNDAPPVQIRRVFNTLTEFDDFPTCFPAQTLSNNIWFEITFPEPISMNSTEFAITSPGNVTNLRFFSNGTVVTMYGVNASNEEVQLARYTEDGVIRAGTIINHPNVIKLNVTDPLEKMSKYIFRAKGSVSGLASVTEIYFDNALKDCVDFDTDGDGVINRLDLDSDGDECSDAVEAGNTLTTNNNITDYPTGVDANNNGLLDKYEDGTSGEINYDSSYTLNALSADRNACADTDGDGIGDLIDIDDDNDGVLDIAETNRVSSSRDFNLYGLFDEFPEQFNGASFTPSDGSNAWVRYPGSSTQTFEIIEGLTLESHSYKYLVSELSPQGGNRLGIGSTERIGTQVDNLVVGEKYEVSFYWINSGRTISETASTALDVFLPDGTTFRTSVHENGTSPWVQEIIVFTATQTSGNIAFGLSAGRTGVSIDGVKIKQEGSGNTEVLDTDNDGVINRLDLDSDGDECSDAVEAGNTLTTNNNITDYPTGVDANNNGLLDKYEDGTSGEINYDSSYTLNALSAARNACSDTDGDGIGDLIDIDDDNDGVLDITEMYSCFISSIGDRREVVDVSTGIALGTSCIFPNSLVDGVVSDTIVRFGTLANQTVKNKTFLKFGFKRPVCLKKIYLQYPYTQKLVPVKDLPPRLVDGAFSHFSPGSVLQLQGSNDGATWTNLNSGSTYGTDPTLNDIPSLGITDAYLETYSVSLNSASFSSYRIQGISGSTSSDMSGSIEVYFETCQSCDLDSLNDTDQDGILNSLDLDSDGDGCSDAVEASNTLVGDNNITAYPTGVDANNNGLLDTYEDGTSGEINYTSTYTENALDNQRDACADTDGDGIGDLIDLDDDNDGILDVDEGCTPLNSLSESEVCDSTRDNDSWIVWSSSTGGTAIGTITIEDEVIAVTMTGHTHNGLVAGGHAPLRWSDSTAYCPSPSNVDSSTPVISNSGNFKLTFSKPIFLPRMHFWSLGAGSNRPLLTFTNNIKLIKDYSININETAKTVQSDGNGAGGNGTIQITDGFVSEILWSVSGAEHWWAVQISTGGFENEDASTGVGECSGIDTDGDGIPDRLDLDSDNDGIFDAVEAGHKMAVHPKGHAKAGRIIDGNVGANGFVNELEKGTETGTYVGTYNGGNGPVNSDNSETIDVTDSDSDNDGCSDVDEAYGNFLPNSLDTNADGTYGGTGTVANNYIDENGIVTEAPYTTPVDRNNDGGADYTQKGLPLSDFAKINSLTPLTIEKSVGDRHVITASLTSVNLYNVVLSWIHSTDEGDTWKALENNDVYSGVHEKVLAIKGITKEMNNTQYKLALYANNNVCSNILSSDTSVLKVRGCEIDLSNAVFTGVAPTNCAPATDGMIQITTAGLTIGTSYKVSYSDGTTTVIASPNPTVDTDGVLSVIGLGLGEYSAITIESLEFEDCTKIHTGTVTIDAFQTDFTVSVDKKDETFFNANDGKITLVPSGGLAPYESSIILNGTTVNVWTGETTSGLSPGVYTIKVIDANKCEFNDSLIVVPVPACSVDVVIQRNKDSIDCFGDEDITLTAVATIPTNSSATHPLSYTWYRGETAIGTGISISNLGVGAYKVVVSSGSGDTLCEGAQEAYIINGPKAVLNGTLKSGDVTSVSPGNEGFVEVTATGGTAPYSYAWKNSAGDSVGGDVARIENLVADVYAVIITDKNGCTTPALFKTVAAPGCFTINNTVGDIKVACFGDTTNVAVAISNGSGNYTINWTSTTTDLAGFVTSNLELIAVPAGTYKVDITDNGLGCSLDETINVTSNEELSGTFVTTHVFCKGESTGTLDLKIAGGDGSYTYLWSSTTTDMSQYSDLTVQDLGGLPVGEYNLLVIDGEGCEANIEGTISEPLTIVSITNVLTTGITCTGCVDGKIEVIASGGTGTLEYSIDEGASKQTSNTFMDLAVGTYIVTVFDENGCFQKKLSVEIIGDNPPDYKPVIYSGNSQIDKDGNVDFVVLIGELLGNDSNGTVSVSFRIIKNPNVTYLFDPTLITLDGRDVNNADWILDNSHSFFMSFTYTGNGGIFKGDTASYVGVTANLVSPNVVGVFPVSVTVKFGSGGEIRTDNNGDKELIKYTK
ncbi:MAG: hypothetical protein COB98_07345 [Flavobacteriaceae bacterium]|nr:MAG: hypothetical protein COB98_07345 [Flavobacteriaceae bacterium]